MSGAGLATLRAELSHRRLPTVPTRHASHPEPDAEWARPPERRSRVSRLLLLVILLIQAMLSLRLANTAFEDEALYLYAGRLELAHLFQGGPAHPEIANCFSGASALYPVLAAAVDSVLGLGGVRTLSLVFMLAATTLLYSSTRLLFNERAALAAAAVFSTAQSTSFLGHFATHEALTVFLLAATTWLVLRTSRSSAVLACLLVPPVMVIDAAANDVALMFLPSIAGIAVLAAWPRRGVMSAVGRGILLFCVWGILLAIVVKSARRDSLTGITWGSAGAAPDTATVATIAAASATWGGPILALAALGSLLYVRQERLNELPGLAPGNLRPPWARFALGGLLCATALLAPLYHAHLHNEVWLHKHIGYGLLFAAPMAGVGASRLVGAHFRHPERGVVIWVLLLVLGLVQSQDRFAAWPDSTRLIRVLKTHLTPNGRYLVEPSWVPQYYLRSVSRPGQWASWTALTYSDQGGRDVSGIQAYRTAIEEGGFDIVVIDLNAKDEVTRTVKSELASGSPYRLLTSIPYRVTTGRAWIRSHDVSGSYQVWVRDR